MTYKVITQGAPLEVWASGFADRAKAQRMVDEGYWHRYMYLKDRHKVLVVVEEVPHGRNT